jgi:hypothetical protein
VAEIIDREPVHERDRDGSKWKFMITMNASQRAGGYDQIDERTDYTYQGIWVGEGMIKKLVGKGSQYLGAYSDSDGRWFDGGKNYTLHVPTNVPANDLRITTSGVPTFRIWRPTGPNRVPRPPILHEVDACGKTRWVHGNPHQRSRRRRRPCPSPVSA